MSETPEQPGNIVDRHNGSRHPQANILDQADPSAGGSAITLGVEEELQVVDGRSGALVPHDIEFAKRNLSDGVGGFACEMHRCTLELQTPIANDPDAIVRSLSALRSFARKEAEARGQKVLAAGLHPFSQWKSQPVHDDPKHYPHYSHLLHEYGDIARGAMSFGLHVHLGLPDPGFRIPVMNALRSVLPDVFALSVSSPFYEGHDTGLASWRHSLLGRYPRMGIPEIWRDEQSYWDHVEKLRKLGSLEPDQAMWDDLRLHHRYGTLEVRICDAVFSLQRIWLIVALLQCEAATLIEEARQGALPEPEPRVWIEENKWRARRHGTRATFVDWRRGENVPVEVRFERWLARLLPAAVKLGLWPRIEMAVADVLSQPTEAEQHRIWHTEAGAFEQLIRNLTEATAVPWIAPTPVRRTHRDSEKQSGSEKAKRKPEPASPSMLRTG